MARQSSLRDTLGIHEPQRAQEGKRWSCHSRVTEWTTIIRLYLPHLSPSQATVLALWSLGMVLARSCALTAVTLVLATWQRRKANTVRQQLREFCYEAAAKQGDKRQAVRVEPCFAPLLAGCWPAGGPQVALALDATTLGSRFVVLAISVVYRGCGIPVAWTHPAGRRQTGLAPGVAAAARPAGAGHPADWTVIVLADRGLYARWLFQAIVAHGWHPFLRVNLGGTFRPAGRARFSPAAPVRADGGPALAGAGHGLLDQPAGLHLAGLLGRGLRRPLAGADRPAAGGGRRRLVRAAGLDRARVQADQARRLAVAAHAHDRPRAGQPVVAGGGGGDAVAGAGRRRGGGHHPREHAARCHGHPGTRDAATRDAAAAGQPVPPGLGRAPGGPARPAPLPLGAFHPEPWPAVPTLDQDLMITPVGAYHDVAA